VALKISRLCSPSSIAHCSAQPSEVGAMAKGGLSKLANLSITLQRRWSNVLTDQQRQHIVEMFLGLRTDTYFPSARLLNSPDLPLEARLCLASKRADGQSK